MFDDFEADTIWDKIKYYYWKKVDHNWRPGQLYYRAKCFLFKRYSTVKSRYLPHTWTDRSELLLYTSFEILSQFIEKECNPGIVDWYYEGGHKILVDGEMKNVRDEMQDLYDWWQSCNKDVKESIYEKDNVGCDKITPSDYKSLLDPTFNEYHELLWNLCKSEEIKRQDIPILNKEGKVYAYKWHTEYKDEEKYREYLFAAVEVEKRHSEYVNNMLKRLVNCREYMWT